VGHHDADLPASTLEVHGAPATPDRQGAPTGQLDGARTVVVPVVDLHHREVHVDVLPHQQRVAAGEPRPRTSVDGQLPGHGLDAAHPHVRSTCTLQRHLHDVGERVEDTLLTGPAGLPPAELLQRQHVRSVPGHDPCDGLRPVREPAGPDAIEHRPGRVLQRPLAASSQNRLELRPQAYVPGRDAQLRAPAQRAHAGTLTCRHPPGAGSTGYAPPRCHVAGPQHLLDPNPWQTQPGTQPRDTPCVNPRGIPPVWDGAARQQLGRGHAGG
jgi:hypothetical protein